MISPKKKFSSIGLGGTFDHFHAGHAGFIDFAHGLGLKLEIGIMQDDLVKSKAMSDEIQPFHIRKRNVVNYCHKIGVPCIIHKLHDQYGPTLGDSTIRGLAVTTETIPGANAINEARQAMGKSDLPVYVFKMIPDELGRELHAINIRKGEIDCDGKLYSQMFAQTLQLNDQQKQKLRQPLGKLISIEEVKQDASHQTIIVGDQTLLDFRAQNLKYDVALFDGKIQRQPHQDLEDVLVNEEIDNEAGTINHTSWKLLSEMYKKNLENSPLHIRVNGEEDLLTLPAIVTAPLGTRVYYGQPNEGLVKCEVTYALKNSLLRILNPDY